MYGVGFLTLRAFVEAGDSLAWYRAKLHADLFRGTEKEAYEFIQGHVSQHYKLPHLDTFKAKFLDAQQLEPKEPSSYYLDHLTKRYEYDVLSTALKDVQEVLTKDKGDTLKAKDLVRAAIQTLSLNERRANLINAASLEGFNLITADYYSQHETVVRAEFGWPYLDGYAEHTTGGMMGGDVASIVGRPQQGKTFLMLYSALHNHAKGRPVLFASMEMGALPITQRVAAMQTHAPLTNLKNKGFTNIGQFKNQDKFFKNLAVFAASDTPLYVLDANLAVYPDELYALAAQLGVHAVYIDGAYLMKHRNGRLDRYTKVAENVEAMKQHSADLDIPTFASWQFNRAATKNKKPGDRFTMEDIGYSDAIPQISTVVLGLSQEEGVDAVTKKLVDVLKGRNGEVGQFDINWNFDQMDFSQIGGDTEGTKEHPVDVDPEAFGVV